MPKHYGCHSTTATRKTAPRYDLIYGKRCELPTDEPDYILQDVPDRLPEGLPALDATRRHNQRDASLQRRAAGLWRSGGDAQDRRETMDGHVRSGYRAGWACEIRI